jgi:pimeloyl-ACP methyl ester carboxylesterase
MRQSEIDGLSARPDGRPRGSDELTGVSVVASPTRSRVDEPVTIIASGLVPGSSTELVVTVDDGHLLTWRSRATFVVAPDGTVDTSRDPAVDGAYTGVDRLGLLWAMTPDGDGPRPFFTKTRTTPLRYTVELVVEDEAVAAAQFVRTFGDVISAAVEDERLVGTIHHPTGPGAWRPVVVFGGSDGGEPQHAGALLAAQGHLVLSLAYHGAEDTPAHLMRIPLEYFEAAVEHVQAHPRAAGTEVALVTTSRGSEAALELAAGRTDVGPLILGAPCGIRQAGLTSDYTDFTKPAWTRDGEPLPFLTGRPTARDWFTNMSAFVLRRPFRQRGTFERALRRADDVAAATIAVEKCRGPILLLVGEEDMLWPSDRYAALVQHRLASQGAPPADVMTFPGAGHFVGMPYAVPSLPPMTRMSPTKAVTIDFGGTAPAQAAAARLGWERTTTLLRDWRAMTQNTGGTR